MARRISKKSASKAGQTDSPQPTKSRGPDHRKPLAAYLLGYSSVTVRLWQYLFWRVPLTPSESQPGWQTWDGVPLTLDQLDQAEIDLADEISPGVLLQLERVQATLRKMNEKWMSLADDPHARSTGFFAGKDPPGEADWENLTSLAERSLGDTSRWRPWLLFGQAIGRGQLALSQLETLDELPDLRPVMECARVLAEAGAAIPEIERLAKCGEGRRQQTPLELIDQILDVKDRERRSKTGKMHLSLLLKKAMSLHERVRKALTGQTQEGQETGGGLGNLPDSATAPDPTAISATDPSPPTVATAVNSSEVKWQDGYLGLQFDEKWRKVRRRGSEATPIVLSKLEWGLLKKLSNEGQSPSRLEELRKIWQDWGKANKPSNGTVRDALSALGAKLKPLGLGIKSIDREVGWTLFATDLPIT